jgi:hypothetical protein
MKKSLNFYFSLCLLVITLCGFKQSVNEFGQLQGRVNINSIQSNRRFAWFADNYSAYQTNPSAITQLTKLSPELSFIIFIGSWDEKSQQVLAQFYKCLDEAKINRIRAIPYFLDRDLKSPQGLEQEFRINQLPTVIVMKGNSEIARISNSSSNSIEADLADIISN